MKFLSWWLPFFRLFVSGMETRDNGTTATANNKTGEGMSPKNMKEAPEAMPWDPDDPFEEVPWGPVAPDNAPVASVKKASETMLKKPSVVIKRTTFDAFGKKLPEAQKDASRRKIAEIDGAEFEGFELKEFAECIDTISDRRNQIIFVTGAAGTGKSSLVRYIQYHFAHLAPDEQKRNIAVVAPTAVAAIAAGAVTIHSFFGFPHEPADSFIADIRPTNRSKLFQKLDILIIDEISMVRADMLDAIEKSLRVNRDGGEPFGGVQIVMVGDMLQLPPIVTNRERSAFAPAANARYSSRYFPGAHCMQNREVYLTVLETVRRQTDHEFVRILSDIRMAKNVASALKILNQKCRRTIPAGIRPIAIVPTNKSSEEINLRELRKINSPEKAYKASISGKFDANNEKKPAPDPLKLKKGAQVMLVKNDPGRRWINGTLGKVVEMRKDSIRVRSLDGGQTFDVGRAKWENLRITYDEQRQRIVSEVIGEYIQFPIALGWAATIHKVQGATLERVFVNMKGGAFDYGQTYVALSRCKSMSGLYLGIALSPGDVMTDSTVLNWYKDPYGEAR